MARKPPLPRPEPGFTLLELLVAIAILAIIGIASYRLLATTITTRERATAHDQQLLQLEKAMQAMQRDFEQTTARPIRDEQGDAEPAFLFPQENIVEFTRAGWRNPLGETRSELVRVRYAVEDGHLRRYHWDVLDRVQDSKPSGVDLLDKVQDFHVRALDSSSRTWSTAWPPLSTATARDKSQVPLPLAVEVVFSVEPYGEMRRIFRVVETANAGTTTSSTAH